MARPTFIAFAAAAVATAVATAAADADAASAAASAAAATTFEVAVLEGREPIAKPAQTDADELEGRWCLAEPTDGEKEGEG
jgi:hypothetical protein